MANQPIINSFISNERQFLDAKLKSFARSFQICIPAIVKEVKSRDTVIVSPAVLQTDIEGQPVQWSDMTVTVLTPFGNGMFLSFPLAVGDTGWLVGADLDTSLFKKQKKPSQQNVFLRNQYNYGFFVPDAINGYNVSNDDANKLVISSFDGETKISLSKDGDVDIVAKTNLKINAQNVIIESNDKKTKIDGIVFTEHVHSGTTLTTTATVGTGGPGTIGGNTGVAE